MWFGQETLALRNGVELLKECKRENVALQIKTEYKCNSLVYLLMAGMHAALGIPCI